MCDMIRKVRQLLINIFFASFSRHWACSKASCRTFMVLMWLRLPSLTNWQVRKGFHEFSGRIYPHIISRFQITCLKLLSLVLAYLPLPPPFCDIRPSFAKPHSSLESTFISYQYTITIMPHKGHNTREGHIGAHGTLRSSWCSWCSWLLVGGQNHAPLFCALAKRLPLCNLTAAGLAKLAAAFAGTIWTEFNLLLFCKTLQRLICLKGVEVVATCAEKARQKVLKDPCNQFMLQVSVHFPKWMFVDPALYLIFHLSWSIPRLPYFVCLLWQVLDSRFCRTKANMLCALWESFCEIFVHKTPLNSVGFFHFHRCLGRVQLELLSLVSHICARCPGQMTFVSFRRLYL